MGCTPVTSGGRDADALHAGTAGGTRLPIASLVSAGAHGAFGHPKSQRVKQHVIYGVLLGLVFLRLMETGQSLLQTVSLVMSS